MNSQVRFTKPTKSFFELFQAGNTLEVKAIIPCELYEILNKEFDCLLPDSDVVVIKGDLFDYAKTNLKFIDSNSEKLMLESITKVGQDEDTKTMSYHLNYLMNKGKITWCINTFLFDINTNHVNFHRLYEAKDTDISTSLNSSKFVFPSKGNYDTLYMVIALIVIAFVGYLIVRSNT